MVVELISVGTELLLGNITNTNAYYLAGKCAGLGLSCFYQVTVGDNEARLCETLQTAVKRSDIVLVTGGLGPTEDDLTKEAAAKVLNMQLVEDKHSRERIAAYFDKLGHEPTENNWKQALVPKGAAVVDNHNGTAPGLIIKTEEGKHVILMPGPPNELYPMFENDIMPYLKDLSPDVILSKTVKLSGLGESYVETKIKDMIDSQTNPTIAPYAKTGEVHLRVTAKAGNEKQAKALLKPVVKELKHRFGKNVFTTDAQISLEDSLITLLKKHGLTVTTAESCTGGLLSGRLINVPGASDVYHEGVVTYADKAKHKLLGVSKDTLKKYGAVSAQTAKEMAYGAAKLAKADVAVSITGLAGPGGATKKKPVGLVYIGCLACGHFEVMECHFLGNREKIRDYSVARALDFARKCILKKYS